MPFDFGPYCATSSFDAASPIFHDIVPALESLNIEVEQVTNNSKIPHNDQSATCFLTCMKFFHSFMLNPGKVSLKYLSVTPLHPMLPTTWSTHVKL